ncbi:MAG: hypothetical protein F6J86_30260 [Symploca sp. SIO1B1]|nr:hypothetical protein [Symploca sp. SIO1C2]NER98065.1 hypothetical protein [Symploca sp. SIO1B1]
MTEERWIQILEENKLMQSLEEVAAFEYALAQLAENLPKENLPALHLILDDRSKQPEVMFSLVHFLESFALDEQLQSFISVVPQLVATAPDWTRILHTRILNDEVACRCYQEKLHAINASSPHFIRQLLEENATYRLSKHTIKT